jgi:hypothetical protein
MRACGSGVPTTRPPPGPPSGTRAGARLAQDDPADAVSRQEVRFRAEDFPDRPAGGHDVVAKAAGHDLGQLGVRLVRQLSPQRVGVPGLDGGPVPAHPRRDAAEVLGHLRLGATAVAGDDSLGHSGVVALGLLP